MISKSNLKLPKGEPWGGGNKMEGWDEHIHTSIYKIDN